MARYVAALGLAALLAPGLIVATNDAAQAREVVGIRDARFEPGTIVIRTGERRLYYVVAPGEAIRYTIAVGKAGKQWRGVKYVEELQVDPAWAPPAEVRRDNPRLPDVIPGGSPRNPMGARVIGLGPGGQYAIHGTNMPNTIGTAASYGCFRMHNQDVIDLYARVQMGTPVVVMP
ncbi:L,D-transpeptidase [Bosea sp. NBC_00550]|uniref:L,D-transpeptidase n=1 Tax=Bosea sp. NBC_00550 TaxID=2969621 RepID=UPI0022310CE5|nr:L,D-transpeptidase [Bosea sp. NBC_00550]UZF91022.1 L,D-transpeptidase [Bosea sp. NBC_00550]